MMNRGTFQLARWAPRILGLLFVLFVSTFAADVFGQGSSLWETLVALFMHLLPSLILLAGLVLAWRWEWVGALVFCGFALQYLSVFGSSFPFSVYALLVGLPFLIGLLFLFEWSFLPQQDTSAS